MLLLKIYNMSMKRIEGGYIFNHDESKACGIKVCLVDDMVAMDVSQDIARLIEAQYLELDNLEEALVREGDRADYSEVQNLAKKVLWAESIHIHFMDLICKSCDIAAEAQRYLDEGWY